MTQYNELQTDLLIVGAGGGGLFAALAADKHSEGDPDITVVVKKLAGKSGCTRMVQGGYNAVLHPDDSIDLHFHDTIAGGKFLNDQYLARRLVEDAPKIIRKLENDLGVFFDRDEQGHIHQKPFAGQSFDRTVHKGDLTGIEIMTRLRDELLTRDVELIEETRAVDLLTDEEGVVGAIILDIRTGEFTAVNAKAVVLATGAGATMYRISTPALEKSADGQAMAYRRGVPLRDMEMMQFHPTGLLAGDTKLTGGVIEEGIRGEGAHLYNDHGERYMKRYAPDAMERATRDIVSIASYKEIMEGRGSENGGVWLDATHLGKRIVEAKFPGMTDRTRNIGTPLSEYPVEVSPTAHYHMGGIDIDDKCRTALVGLLAAGEDAGGAHGANRLGGNGVVDSTVLGRIAGETFAREFADAEHRELNHDQVESVIERMKTPLRRSSGEDVYEIRDELETTMWELVGVVRNGDLLADGINRLKRLRDRLNHASVAGSPRYNLEWNQYMDVENLLCVATLVAIAADARTESRGAHYREDYPDQNDDEWLKRIRLTLVGSDTVVEYDPVAFPYVHPGELSSDVKL